MRQGGVDVVEVFDQTRVTVNQETQGALLPWSASKLTEPYYIFERAADAPPPAIATAVANQSIARLPADAAYAAALQRDTIRGYEEYLAHFRADEAEMTEMQSRADEVYAKAGRRAPPPLPYERPGQFRRRLAQGLQEYSPRLRDIDVASLADDALRPVEAQVYADAVANAPTHGLGPTEIRVVEKVGAGGHHEREYAGGPRARRAQ